jgi:hypothetical protein
MELAWQWRGYGISIRVMRDRVRTRNQRPKAYDGHVPEATSDGARNARRQHLLASGSRYIGPIR